MADVKSLDLDPRAIIIRPGRQRTGIDISDLKPSIEVRGILEPIIVEQSTLDGKIYLVAGERRLTSALELSLSVVPCRLWTDLSIPEREIIEFEENLRRRDLPWRDQARAYRRLHDLFAATSSGPPWSINKSAEKLNVHGTYLRRALHVAEALDDSPKSRLIFAAQSINQAYDLLAADTTKANGAIKAQITETVFAKLEPGTRIQPPTSDAIICADFTTWAANYSGPKFTLIHCDSPSVILALLKSYAQSLISNSAHLIYWFRMDTYNETQGALEYCGFRVNPAPFIWHMTNITGSSAQPTQDPLQVYSTAFICTRGNRPLATLDQNLYPGPKPLGKAQIHPGQQSEPMLKHLLAQFLTPNSLFLDPACGSGAAVRAAESLGAKQALGIEVDPKWAVAANEATRKFRALKGIGR